MINGQMDIFYYLYPKPKDKPLPCETCKYDVMSCCDYPGTVDDYCILGDKWIPKFKAGDWIEKEHLGDKLTFDEITQEVGNLIIIDKSTVSREWYKVVLVESIVETTDGRKLVYYDGTRRRGYINEMYFNETITFPSRAWRLKA